MLSYCTSILRLVAATGQGPSSAMEKYASSSPVAVRRSRLYAQSCGDQQVFGKHENMSDARESTGSRQPMRCLDSNDYVQATSNFVGEHTRASNEMGFDTQKFILKIESRKAIWDLSCIDSIGGVE